MTDSLPLPSGAVVQLAAPRPPIITAPAPTVPPVLVMPVPGVPGPPGGAFDGTAWWTGSGPPGAVVGSKPGDYYVDTLTGIVYKLGD